MCGRYKLFTGEEFQELDRILRNIDEKYGSGAFRPGEVYPTNQAPVLFSGESDQGNSGVNGELEVELFSWGFPWLGKDKRGKSTVINAKAETAKEKPMFRRCFEDGRCIVPAAGFFEWKNLSDTTNGKAKKTKKEKYLFYSGDGKPIYMAGLFKKDQDVSRFVILTTEANRTMEGIHDRMPLILKLEQARRWVTDQKEAEELLLADPPDLLRKAVNPSVQGETEQLSFMNSI